jgi:dTDP-4-amino-4,6-dideoxygalactose transaminase
LYVIRVKTESIGRSHLEVFELLRELGVGVNLHYIPVHTQPFYAQRGFKPEDFPQAMKYYGQAISLPIFPNLTQSMQEHIVQALTTVLQ